MNTSFNNFLMSRFSQISINRALFATVDTRISAGIDQDFHEGEKQTDLILNMALKTVKTIKKVRSSVQELRTLSRSTCSHDRMNAVFGVFFRSFSDPCSQMGSLSATYCTMQTGSEISHSLSLLISSF